MVGPTRFPLQTLVVRHTPTRSEYAGMGRIAGFPFVAFGGALTAPNAHEAEMLAGTGAPLVAVRVG